MASTGPSPLTQYRPLILTAVGAAAAYGAFLSYCAFSARRNTVLRRSHAGNRRRARPPRLADRSAAGQVVDTPQHGPPSQGPTLGTGPARITLGENSIVVPLNQELLTVQTIEELQIIYSLSRREAQLAMEQLEDHVVNSYVRLSFYPSSNLEQDIALMRLLHDWMQGRQVRPERIMSMAERWNENERNTTRNNALSPDATMEASGGDNADAATEVSWQTAFVPYGVSHESTRRNSDGHNLKSMLYYIAEDQARQEGYVHRGVTCNSCDTKPIRGIRWRCANCADYDLCSDCETLGMHPKTHIFYKVRIPAPFLGNPRQAQPVLYPGRPNLTPRYLPADLKLQMCKETRYESSELDALWDQFTSLANYRLRDNDPHELGAAIDRKAFDKSFVPHAAISPPAPNLIYDRMFSYYDVNGDGLIDFEEFIRGLAILHGRVQTSRLRMVFKGYDIDGDGMVSRKDFLRMFRAYYAIQKEITRDLIAVQEEDLSAAGALDMILSSQPLNSAFTEGPIVSSVDPQSTRRKHYDRFGDIRQSGSVLNPDGDDLGNRERVILESGDGQMLNGALVDRWGRRDFYTDVEEGFVRPDSAGSSSSKSEGEYSIANGSGSDGEMNGKGPKEPRSTFSASRSSSKVRFSTNLNHESGSNTTSSARPHGERLGGYEIPQAEKDIGQEILYQVTQQGFNELLDPLFKAKEDLAMEIKLSKPSREYWKLHIDRFLASKGAEQSFQQESKVSPLLEANEIEHKFWNRFARYEHFSVTQTLFRGGAIESPDQGERFWDILISAFAGESEDNIISRVDEFVKWMSLPATLLEPLSIELIEISKDRSTDCEGRKLPEAVLKEAVRNLRRMVEITLRLGFSNVADDADNDSSPSLTPVSHSESSEESVNVMLKRHHSTTSTPSLPPSPTSRRPAPASTSHSPVRRDMTFPQFRPNSNADVEAFDRRRAHELLHSQPSSPIPTRSRDRANTSPLTFPTSSSTGSDLVRRVYSAQSTRPTPSPTHTPSDPPSVHRHSLSTTSSAAHLFQSSSTTATRRQPLLRIPHRRKRSHNAKLKRSHHMQEPDQHSSEVVDPNGRARFHVLRDRITTVPPPTPPQAHIKRLAYLERLNREAAARGVLDETTGEQDISPLWKLDFDEFEAIMQKDGRGLGFVEQWLEVGSF